MQVVRLGYLGIGTTRLDEWRDLADQILAAEISDGIEAGARALALRIDKHPFRILLIDSDKDDVLFAGWEADDAAGFAQIVDRLNAAGVVTEAVSAETLAARDAQDVIRFRDPDGYLNELYWGPRLRSHAPEISGGHQGYVTGDLGLGHIMRHCAHYPEMVAFYTDILGFRLSDKIVWEGADASFLRCNRRHHSLALINESLGMKSGDTNHVMLELRHFEDVVTAYEKVLSKDYPIIMTLGRHSNCKTVSFYFVGPSGFGIEIGHGSHLVNEADWQVAQYNTTKIWGHLLPHERMKELI